ncbi:MAG: DNA-directed RNA polymerase subunit omega [Firmicutes bacterium]|nr:DNA-directed RNA polymerase subunit omega [Bacillota bacterium]
MESRLDPTLEEVLAAMPRKYAVVNVAAQRARQLLEGAAPAVAKQGSKPVVVALKEIAQSKVTYEVNGTE